MSTGPKKRLIFCFDGTHNELSTPEPTNVARMAQSITPIARDGIPQIVYYDEGIGTGVGLVRKYAQGAFGWGLDSILREAYRFLIFNHQPGDEIYAFGFSRGAFTARSFLGFIRHAGILDVVSATQIDEAIKLYKEAPAEQMGAESVEALKFRLQYCRQVCVSEADREHRIENDPSTSWQKTPLINLRYLGVWDTVSALGLPKVLPFSAWFRRRYRFHDATLTSKIQSARHAVALDEESEFFPVTLFGKEKVETLNMVAERRYSTVYRDWERPYQEKWFPGVHGSVGGGGPRKGLPDGALAWVLAGARHADLDVRTNDDARTFDIEPDHTDFLIKTERSQNILAPLFRLLVKELMMLFTQPRAGPASLDDLSVSAKRRMSAPIDTLQAEDHPSRWPSSLVGAFQALLNRMRGSTAVRPDEFERGYFPRALHSRPDFIKSWEYYDQQEIKSGYVIRPDYLLPDIARDVLGDPKRYMEIFEANRDRLEDPKYYPSGIEVRAPTD